MQRSENAKERDEPRAAKDIQAFRTTKVTNELIEAKDMQTFESSKDTDELISAAKAEQSRPVEEILELKLVKDFEELKLKLNFMDSQLREVHSFYLRFNIVTCILEVSVHLFAIHLFKGSDLGILMILNIIIFSLNHLQFSYLKVFITVLSLLKVMKKKLTKVCAIHFRLNIPLGS